MSWKIEIKPAAEKRYLQVDKKTRRRIKKSLLDLGKYENPLLHPKVRPLVGKLRGDYRLRVGDWRVLFTPDKDQKIIYVYAILPRGDAS